MFDEVDAKICHMHSFEFPLTSVKKLLQLFKASGVTKGEGTKGANRTKGPKGDKMLKNCSVAVSS